MLFIFEVAILLFWLLLTTRFPELSFVPRSYVYISLLTAFLLFPWTMAHPTIILDGRAGIFSIFKIGETLIWATVLLGGLFVFRWGVLTLFVAKAISSAFLFIGAIIIFAPYARFRIEREWAKRIINLGVNASVGSFSEKVFSAVERSVLTIILGPFSLGLYNHSQKYHKATVLLQGAFADSIWPVTLEEARAENPTFRRTMKGWDVIYLFIGLSGIGAATLGSYVISWLTNDKFTAAAIFVPFWMIVLLIQLSGRGANGILFSHDEGIYLARLQTASMVITIALLFIFIPAFGVAGALAVTALQHLIYRIGMQIKSIRHYHYKFEDKWPLIYTSLILLTLGISTYFPLKLAQNAILFSCVSLLTIYLARDIVTYGIQLLRSTLQAAIKSA